MEKKFLLTILIVVFSFALTAFSFAQAMVRDKDDHTVREEAEGRAIWEKMQAKEITCKELSDKEFGVLGEYFMGKMAGSQHEIMNNMMIQMMGEEGEKQMHIAMGRRMSECNLNASLPQTMINRGMMPMITMMMGGGMFPVGFWSVGVWGWIWLIVWWILIIIGTVAIINWFRSQFYNKQSQKQSALDILKERYARGEISKREFEEKKKDLD